MSSFHKITVVATSIKECKNCPPSSFPLSLPSPLNHSYFSFHHSSLVTRHSSLISHHSSITHHWHWSITIQHSPFTIHSAYSACAQRSDQYICVPGQSCTLSVTLTPELLIFLPPPWPLIIHPSPLFPHPSTFFPQAFKLCGFLPKKFIQDFRSKISRKSVLLFSWNFAKLNVIWPILRFSRNFYMLFRSHPNAQWL